MRALIPALILLSSCSLFDGRDPHAAAVNTVTKSYPRPADETWRAVEAVSKEMDLWIDTNQHDALGGTMVAMRSNKDEVRVEARSADSQNTTVSIMVEP